MRKITVILVVLVFACSFLAGCQPTPEEVVIRSKGDLQEKITETEETNAYTATDNKLKFVREFSEKNKFEFDAEVIGQDVKNIAVYDVYKKSFEDGDPLKNRLEKALENYSFSRFFFSKEYYTEELETYRLWLERYYNNQDCLTGQPITDERDQNGIHLAKKYQVEVKPGEEPEMPTREENLLALIEEAMVNIQQAPSEDEVLPTDFLFEQNEHDGKSINISAKKEGEMLSINITDNSLTKCLWIENITLQKQENYCSYTEQIDIDAETDPAYLDNRRLADELIINLGGDYFLLDKAFATKDKDAYVFRYTRKLGDMREVVVGEYYTTVLDTDLSPHRSLWRPELVTVEIRDGRLYRMHWDDVAEVEKTMENVKVLPWEEILKIAEKQLEFIVKPNEDVFNIHTDIVIHRVEFGYTKIAVQDTLEDYQLIPTWNFFGHDRINESRDICFLTINAIDGTVVDHKLGY